MTAPDAQEFWDSGDYDSLDTEEQLHFLTREVIRTHKTDLHTTVALNLPLAVQMLRKHRRNRVTLAAGGQIEP